MKKYFKILVLIIVLSTSRIKGVKAEYFYEDNWITGVYANLVDGDFSKPQLMRFIKSSTDNRVAYCLTPRELLYYNVDYSKTEEIDLTQAQIERIKKLSYYGYGYQNHTSDEWYAITQFMIWKTVEPNMDIFFTDKYNGNRITRFTNEINELETLVNTTLPPLDLYAYGIDINNDELNLNQTYELYDHNNMLSNYDVYIPDNVFALSHDNKLELRASSPGEITLEFVKKYRAQNTEAAFLKASKGQKLYLPGDLEDISYFYTFKISKASIK